MKHAVALLVLIVFSGCGGRSSTVTGRVTFGGAPLSRGNVFFQPVAGGAPAFGTIAPDGTYRLQTGPLDGLLPGEYAVTVTSTTAAEMPTASNPEPVPKSIIPVRYGTAATSGLTFTVRPGSNEFDIQLKE